MGTRIVIGLTGGAIGFMLYTLYHFVREGQRHQPTKADGTVVVMHHRREHEPRAKAA